MLQLLLLMQLLEYILNSNIIYFAVDIDKNYEQKTHFARIKPEVEEFYMSGVGVDFVHEWGESDWRVGAADLSYLQPRHQALGSDPKNEIRDTSGEKSPLKGGWTFSYS